jgi:hypothetical protein
MNALQIMVLVLFGICGFIVSVTSFMMKLELKKRDDEYSFFYSTISEVFDFFNIRNETKTTKIIFNVFIISFPIMLISFITIIILFFNNR